MTPNSILSPVEVAFIRLASDTHTDAMARFQALANQSQDRLTERVEVVRLAHGITPGDKVEIRTTAEGGMEFVFPPPLAIVPA